MAATFWNSLAIAALLSVFLESAFYTRPTMLQQARATRARRARGARCLRGLIGRIMLPAACSGGRDRKMDRLLRHKQRSRLELRWPKEDSMSFRTACGAAACAVLIILAPAARAQDWPNR